MSKKTASLKTKKSKQKDRTFFRLLGYLFRNYKASMTVVIVCLLFSSLAMVSCNIFLQKLIDDCIRPALVSPDGLGSVMGEFVSILVVMGTVFALGVLASFIYGRIGAIVSHKFFKRVREDMFNRMQSLPIRYFDTHTHGDIMSTYTNDTDALMQMIGQCIPGLLQSALTLTALLFVMLSYSLWLTLIVLAGVLVMGAVTAFLGGRSAKYFLAQQKALGKTEGYVEEMIHGQKVIKVFCHEEAAKRDFDVHNAELLGSASRANTYANVLMPVMGNIGNLLYVVLAIVGGALALNGVTNVSLMGVGVLSVGVVVSFLTMSRMFSGNVGQIAQLMNAVVMAIAGGKRVFALLDETSEADEGYVTLVNAEKLADGSLQETNKRTECWAWRHPHRADGTVTYTEVCGHILLDEVDFAYEEGKPVLHDVSVEAMPGQRIALVGSTGAGKTTITNLLNRFYDIADGKVRYDGINVNKIKKADLRRSLGMVLQDTNLFTGSVMENIRYGRLEATDGEVIAAAELAGAHDFITRLPEGYFTLLSADGANLSQGQRQLLSIARAAVADAPVMILDEATSSIDTRTEALVQHGTDRLMKGRTVFIIAHRLSTVRNADVILVLEHGRIIERGNHEQLIALKGKYYQLYTGVFELD